MFAGPPSSAWKASQGDHRGWPPVERIPHVRSGGPSRTALPPCVYVFRNDDPRPLYVGKAGSNPGDRIKAHFDGRKPWALAATRIELNWLPYGADLDAAEQALIHAGRPRGNKQHNRVHHDAAWARQVELAHTRAVGGNLPVSQVIGLWVLVLRAWLGSAARTLVTVAVVDVALLMVWIITHL